MKDAVPSENEEEAVLGVETVTVVVGRRRREVGRAEGEKRVQREKLFIKELLC